MVRPKERACSYRQNLPSTFEGTSAKGKKPKLPMGMGNPRTIPLKKSVKKPVVKGDVRPAFQAKSVCRLFFFSFYVMHVTNVQVLRERKYQFYRKTVNYTFCGEDKLLYAGKTQLIRIKEDGYNVLERMRHAFGTTAIFLNSEKYEILFYCFYIRWAETLVISTCSLLKCIFLRYFTTKLISMSK